MAFYNQGIKPYPFNKIKIQDFGNTPTNKNIARHHGIDGSETYALNKNAILCFASDYNIPSEILQTDEELEAQREAARESAPEGETEAETEANQTAAAEAVTGTQSTPGGEQKSQRVVTFKAFLDSFSIKLNISKEEKKRPNTFYIPTYLDKIGLSYSVSFNVVAHSVNEAISNLARFAELERILMWPFVKRENPGDAQAKRFPSSYVLFANLINNGGYWELFDNESFTYSFENIRKYALRAVIKDIKMTPDLEMGFFEFNGQNYFKAFKINLDLVVPNIAFNTSYEQERKFDETPPEGETPVTKLYTLRTLQATNYEINNSTVAEWAFLNHPNIGADTQGFPFNIPTPEASLCPISNKTVVNDFINQTTALDTADKTYSDNKHSYFSITINSPPVENYGPLTLKYLNIKFKCYIDSFDYSREQEVSDFAVGDIYVANPIFTATNTINYNFKINVVANNISEAMDNCIKLAYLMRLAPGTNGVTTAGFGTSTYKNKILLSNLIKNPNSTGANLSHNLQDTYDHGLAVEINSLDLEIDQDMGFFEKGIFFVPKAFSLNFNVRATNFDHGKMITTGSSGKNFWSKLQGNNDSIYWPFGIKYDDPKED